VWLAGNWIFEIEVAKAGGLSSRSKAHRIYPLVLEESFAFQMVVQGFDTGTCDRGGEPASVYAYRKDLADSGGVGWADGYA
jgi:hypothetical protein